jgi:hypothetical protein
MKTMKKRKRGNSNFEVPVPLCSSTISGWTTVTADMH